MKLCVLEREIHAGAPHLREAPWTAAACCRFVVAAACCGRGGANGVTFPKTPPHAAGCDCHESGSRLPQSK
ncbi:MAG TPA: hypothetical protein VGO11_14005, partial [Chthoniobacteraceae bacterium]|nr:hypothetical protein [Chthoniobacteraceae bacterium]